MQCAAQLVSDRRVGFSGTYVYKTRHEQLKSKCWYTINMIHQGFIPEQIVQLPSWPHAQLQELGDSVGMMKDGSIHFDHCMVLTTSAKFAP